MPRPDPSEYAAYYGSYIALVPEDDVVTSMESQLAETLEFLRHVPEADANVCHAPYTWSIKDVVGHLIDSERVFGYRALRFARGDTAPLPGFDENAYALVAESNRRTLGDMIAEFESLRRSHLWLFRGLSDAAWHRKGTANGAEVSVRALAYILVGHVRHHCGIIRKRLVDSSASR